MSSRGDTDGRSRVASPVVPRRHVRPRDARNTMSHDHILDPRILGRELSPAGKVVAGNSSASSVVLTSRGYRDRRPLDQVDSAVTGHGHFTPTSSRTRSRDPSPARAAAVHSHDFLNGEPPPCWQSAHRGGVARPRSFPEPRGTVPELTRHAGNHDDLSRIAPASLRGQQQQQGPSNGLYEQQALVSPTSEEAMSSLTAAMVEDSMARMELGSEMMEGSFTCDDGYTWHSALTCYLCAQLFRRPRILPCGHTFCSECLVQLKEESIREGLLKRLPDGVGGHSACLLENRGKDPTAVSSKTDIAALLVCPMPECRYSMRLINLSRWSTRNKTVTNTISALRRMYEKRQDASTQTDITLDSMLVTIPRSFIQENLPPGGQRGLMRSNSSALMDRMVHRAMSMDSLSNRYIPQQHGTWRSYVAMLGMHILQQVMHT